MMLMTYLSKFFHKYSIVPIGLILIYICGPNGTIQIQHEKIRK